MLAVGSEKAICSLSENVRASADLPKTYAKVLLKMFQFQTLTIKQ